MDLDRAAMERVLRRATEMTPAVDHADLPSGRVSEEVLLASAAEVGIDPEAVRISLAIERLGEGTPPSTKPGRVLGPSEVVSDRIVAIDPNTLLGRLDDLLVKQHQMSRARSRADRGEWRKRGDAVGVAQRLARAAKGERLLGGHVRVEARTVPIDAQRTAVRIVVDRSAKRRDNLIGGVVVTGLVGAPIVALSIIATPFIAVAAPLAAVAGVAAARADRSEARDTAGRIEQLLDQAEDGVRPVRLSDDVRRVLRQITR
jgi:hypothetical protein